jgi:uncharacterized protein (TIGR02594 family)
VQTQTTAQPSVEATAAEQAAAAAQQSSAGGGAQTAATQQTSEGASSCGCCGGSSATTQIGAAAAPVVSPPPTPPGTGIQLPEPTIVPLPDMPTGTEQEPPKRPETDEPPAPVPTQEGDRDLSEARQRIVQIARSQVGVTEDLGENRGTEITKYQKAVTGGSGTASIAWCAFFTSWVYQQAGLRVGFNGKGDGWVYKLGDWGKETGRFKAPGTKPVAGDIILLEGSGPHWTDHVGVVEKVDANGTVHAIEGNSSDAVRRRTYSQNSGEIKGFVNAE